MVCFINSFMQSGMWMIPFFFMIFCAIMMVLGFSRFSKGNFFQNDNKEIRGVSGNTDVRNDSNAPLSILKNRYAKGEISKEEFDEMKRDLI